MDKAITLGSFRLEERIGRGGMGEIWRGAHISTGEPVAIKMLTSRRALHRRLQQAFVREAHVLAGLYHPNIVKFHDLGQITPEAEEASGGRLASGCPWLAMEFARGGVLAEQAPVTSWGEMRGVLIAILDALAHAHARDVIHRDIKPENVLVQHDENGEGRRYLLTDFGIAWALGDYSSGEEEAGRAIGSVHYISPEQILGDWRDQGPWTDLYAVGCLGWWLATGRPPFADAKGGLGAVVTHHLNTPLPDLKPRFALPEGAARWLHRMLGKSPFRRYWRAADALFGLLELGWSTQTVEIEAAEEVSWAGSPMTEGDLVVGTQPALHTVTSARRAPVVDPLSLIGHDARKHGATVFKPPLNLPTSWRAPGAGPPPAPLPGVGLRLLPARGLPLVGRELERDRLWAALYQTVQQRTPRGVILRGEGGVGKTRLARWLCERSHELGSCFTIQINSLVADGGQRGLQQLISDLLRLFGLSWDEALPRVRALVKRFGIDDPLWIEMITHIACPRPDAGPFLRGKHDIIGADHAEEARFLAVTQILRGLSAHRPVILFLDDAHRDPELIRYLAWLMGQRGEVGRMSLLFVATAGGEKQRPDPRWEELALHPQVETLQVGPLPDKDVEAMLRGLLELEPPLMRRLLRATRNNPLFAIQLLNDWIQRDLLVYRPGGFGFESGGVPRLPENVQGVWASRLESVYAKVGAPGAITIAIAAALGGELDVAEWGRVAAACFSPPPELVIGPLQDAGLLLRVEERWVFVHRLLRDHIEEVQRRAGTWTGVHRAIAEVLERGPRLGPGAHLLRVGWHFAAASSYERALPWFIQAHRSCVNEGDFSGAAQALDLWQRSCALLDPAQTTPVWLLGWLLRADLDRRLGAFDASIFIAQQAQRLAERLHDREMQGLALLEEGISRASLGRVREEREPTLEGIQLQKRALTLLEDPDACARAELGIFYAFLHLKELERAEVHAQAALTLARERLHEPVAVAEVELGLAHLALSREQPEEALRLAQRASATFEQRGAYHAASQALFTQGEAFRLLRAWPEAERDYRAALQRLEGTGNFYVQLLRLGLARTLIHLQRPQEALNYADHLLRALEGDDLALNACAWCAVIAASALLDLPERIEDARAALGKHLHPALASAEAELLEIAAEALVQNDRRRSAVQILQLAAETWWAQGQAARAERLFAQMLQLAATPPRRAES